MLKVVHDTDAPNENGAAGGSLLDEIVRDGARAMLAAALQAEVAAYIDAHLGEVDEAGHRLVVRNGFHQPREVVTAAGAVGVRAPRVNDKRIDETTGERKRFSSAILGCPATTKPYGSKTPGTRDQEVPRRLRGPNMCSAKRAIWLWLLVIFVGIQFGAGWYEKLGIVPLWADLPPDQVLSAMEDSGMKRAGRAFWPFVSPVVALLSLVSLYVGWRSPAPMRRWWIAGAGLMAAYALASYTFFVPQMLMFQSSGDTWSPERVDTFVTWWTGLNYPRMVLGGLGWLCLLRALSLSATSTRTAVNAAGLPASSHKGS